MTNIEQAEAERALADDPSIDAPADLHEEDVSVEEGKHERPRKAA